MGALKLGSRTDSFKLNCSLPCSASTNVTLPKLNDIIRGFVRRVTDSGLFVAVSNDITAYVRVSDLSDSYLKEWKDSFQPDQLVKGKVTFVAATKRPESVTRRTKPRMMSLSLTSLSDEISRSCTGKNEVLRACVIAVDKSNKKIALSLRPSKVMSAPTSDSPSCIMSWRSVTLVMRPGKTMPTEISPNVSLSYPCLAERLRWPFSVLTAVTW
jgi:predicted RNA-binding protein with RPS1 domain